MQMKKWNEFPDHLNRNMASSLRRVFAIENSDPAFPDLRNVRTSQLSVGAKVLWWKRLDASQPLQQGR
jgi:hypothetical protein